MQVPDISCINLNLFISVKTLGHIVHPESFRSNAQNANVFARRNRPRVERNDEFACIYLRSFACVHLRSFASTVCDRLRAHIYTYIRKVWAWHYLR